jgi:hypothetical protein
MQSTGLVENFTPVAVQNTPMKHQYFPYRNRSPLNHKKQGVALPFLRWPLNVQDSLRNCPEKVATSGVVAGSFLLSLDKPFPCPVQF